MDISFLRINFFIALGLLILEQHTSNGLKCYDCLHQSVLGTSNGDESCQNPSDELTRITDCPYQCAKTTRESRVGTEIAGGYQVSNARKYRYQSVTRSCVRQCNSGSYRYGGYASDTLCCNSNLCNAATSIRTQLATLSHSVAAIGVVFFLVL